MSQSGVLYSSQLQLRDTPPDCRSQTQKSTGGKEGEPGPYAPSVLRINCRELLHQDWWHSSSCTRPRPRRNYQLKNVKTLFSSWGQCNPCIYIWGHFQACCLLCIEKRFANICRASLSSACSAGLQSAFTLHYLTRTRPEIDRGWKVWMFCNLGQCFILITSF